MNTQYCLLSFTAIWRKTDETSRAMMYKRKLMMKDGKPILEGATKLILTVVDVDAPSRILEWKLK